MAATVALSDPSARRPTIAIVAICAVFFVLGANRLWVPGALYFDEKWYVDAALKMQRGIVINREHPPLAKEMMAAIIGVGGMYWVTLRIGSLIMATLGLFGLMHAQFNHTRSARSALLCGVLVAGNCLYLTTARIALLDPFMLGFAGLALAPYTAALRAEARRAGALLGLAGVLIGLSIACKWTSLPLFAAMGLGVLWRSRRSQGAMIGHAALFGLSAAAAYLIPFAPLILTHEHPIALTELPALHRAMYHTLGLLIGLHPSASVWWQWPMGGGALWLYGIAPTPTGRMIVVALHPGAAAAALAALAALPFLWRSEAGRQMRAPAFAWLLTLAFWASGEKPVQFIYSYNLGAIFAASVTAIALAQMRGRWRWLMKAGIAVYLMIFASLYPVLTGAAHPVLSVRIARSIGWLAPVDTRIGKKPIGNGYDLMAWSTACLNAPMRAQCSESRTNTYVQSRESDRR